MGGLPRRSGPGVGYATVNRALAVKLALFAGALLLAGATATVWRGGDYLLLRLVQQAQPAAARDDLLLLELPGPASSAAFRQLLGRALQQLATRHPAAVVVDVNVTEGEGTVAVADGVRALLSARARVYMGVRTDLAANDTQARSVYLDAPITGVGHTELIPDAGLYFYKTRIEVPVQGVSQAYTFLPLLLIAPPAPGADNLPVVLSVPAPGAALPEHRATADGSLGPDFPALLDNRTVLVASTERECRQPDSAGCTPGSGWSNPQLLYWALADLSGPGDRHAPRPITDGLTQLLVALASAVVGVALHALALRWAIGRWSPLVLQRRLALLDAAAWLLLLLLVAALVALLLHIGWVLPVTLAVLISSTALLLAHWHSSQDLAESLWLLRRRADSAQGVADTDIFISYSHESANADWVERELLAPLQALRNAQGEPLRIFFDRSSIVVGQDWFQRINLSLLGTRCLLCIWSDDYHLRDYCRWELEYGFRRAAGPGFLFLPVLRLTPGAPLDPFYRTYVHARQYLDARAGAETIAQLLDQVRQHLGASAVTR